MPDCPWQHSRPRVLKHEGIFAFDYSTIKDVVQRIAHSLA